MASRVICCPASAGPCTGASRLTVTGLLTGCTLLSSTRISLICRTSSGTCQYLPDHVRQAGASASPCICNGEAHNMDRTCSCGSTAISAPQPAGLCPSSSEGQQQEADADSGAAVPQPVLCHCVLESSNRSYRRGTRNMVCSTDAIALVRSSPNLRYTQQQHVHRCPNCHLPSHCWRPMQAAREKMQQHVPVQLHMKLLVPL